SFPHPSRSAVTCMARSVRRPRCSSRLGVVPVALRGDDAPRLRFGPEGVLERVTDGPCEVAVRPRDELHLHHRAPTGFEPLLAERLGSDVAGEDGVEVRVPVAVALGEGYVLDILSCPTLEPLRELRPAGEEVLPGL